MAPPIKRHVIPIKGNFVAADFCTRAIKPGRLGKCLVCDLAVSHLSSHFAKYHSTPDTRSSPIFVKRVSSLHVPPNTVHPGNGFCGLCVSEDGKPVPIEELRAHYVEEHREGKWVCPVCDFKCSPKIQTSHILTHSGRVKCTVKGCKSKPETYSAAKHHLYRCHKEIEAKDRHRYIEDLSEEEYKEEILKQAAASGKWAKKRDTRKVRTVLEVRKKLESYHNKRLGEDPELMQKINTLFAKFLDYFEVPQDDDIIVVKNSSFISFWKVSWMSPILVFQLVPKTAGKEQMQATTFHPDQQVGRPNQPHMNSFLHSGYAKGHMAPGADFRDLEEFIQSHLFTNICAMRRYLNWIVRPKMEHYIREKSNSQEEPVFVAHVPIMKGGLPTTLNGIRIADRFGCVLISEESRGPTMIGWELLNNDKWQDFKKCVIDPFAIFENSNIQFRRGREEFTTIHTTTPELGVTTSSSTATATSFTITSSASSTSPAPEENATPSRPRTSPLLLDISEVDEEIADDIELGKTDLTQILQDFEMEQDDKSQEEGVKDGNRKRAPTSSPSSSSPIIKKKKSEDTPQLTLSGGSGISIGGTDSDSTALDLDPDAADFKRPLRQTSLANYLRIFRVKPQSK